MLSKNDYAINATAEVPLYYDRFNMEPGSPISGYIVNKGLIDGLANCDSVVFSMFWKPIGDSFLFLSVIQACYEYLLLTRKTNMPQLVIDSTFANLVKHISYLKDAKVVDKGVDWFKSEIKNGQKVVLITDDDPFEMGPNPPIFNSEEYSYPKFIEKHSDAFLVEYPSRPARYFLTFEREVGIRLISDPNESLPVFIMGHDENLRQKIIANYGFDPDSDKNEYIGIISQASMPEKKFGCIRFLGVADKIGKIFKNPYILILANPKEESAAEWLALKKKLNKNTILLTSDDFEMLAYIFARCTVCIGNDTGFSHLAAMSTSSTTDSLPPTFITYSRHDYSKWGTGKKNVIQIPTKLSKYLKENNMSIRRDKIEVKDWGILEWAYSIPITRVVNRINSYYKNV